MGRCDDPALLTKLPFLSDGFFFDLTKRSKPAYIQGSPRDFTFDLEPTCYPKSRHLFQGPEGAVSRHAWVEGCNGLVFVLRAERVVQNDSTRAVPAIKISTQTRSKHEHVR